MIGLCPGFFPDFSDIFEKAHHGPPGGVHDPNRYIREVKHEAVERARNPSTSIRQVALELGLNPNMLARWKQEADQGDAPAFQCSGTARNQELVAVRRELARVKKERDFLRDAAAFFARESS